MQTSRSLTHLHFDRLCCADKHYAAAQCTCHLSSEEEISSSWHYMGKCHFFPTEALPTYLPHCALHLLEHEHIVQYHTYHPCETKCNSCELFVWRVQLPSGNLSELGYAPKEVCDRGDNTDIVGVPQDCLRDIVLNNKLPVLHDSSPAPVVICDCAGIERATIEGGGVHSATLGSWRNHGHWQVISEHHECRVCVGICTADLTDTPIPVVAYTILSAKGFQPRRGWHKFVESQSTQTDDPFIPSLEQSSLCTKLQSAEPPVILNPLPLPPEPFRFHTSIIPAFDPRDRWRECTLYEESPNTPAWSFVDLLSL